MAIKLLKNGKCSKCGTPQEYFVYENIDDELNLSNYLLFKTVNLNVCENCGYLNDNLEKDNGDAYFHFNNSQLNENEDILQQISMLECYVKEVKNPLKKLRVLSNIFKLKKFEFDKFLSKNYTKKDVEIIDKLDKSHKNLIALANEILSQTELVEQIDFVKCLQIELYAYLGNTIKAEKLLQTICPKDDLKDYLLDCIDLGGNE